MTGSAPRPPVAHATRPSASAAASAFAATISSSGASSSAPPASALPDGRRGARTLVVRDLTCTRGGRVLFRHFDLTLEPGRLVWLRAANGFGKTTLLRRLAGLAVADRGSIEWVGGPSGAPGVVVYLAHANALKDDLTVVESLRHLLRLHGVAATDAAVGDAIGRFGLWSRRHAPVRTLSQGQRRRVALARLLFSDAAATWLLDEPFDALDADGIDLVATLLVAHAERGGNAVFTSHVAPDVASGRLSIVRLDEPSSAAVRGRPAAPAGAVPASPGA